MSESLNYIEAYFTGQLSDAEKRQFEQQCEADQEFAADVAFYVTSRQAIRQKLLEEKRTLWADAEARPQMVAAAPSITGKKVVMLNRWVSYAVAASLILAVSFYFLNRSENPHQLASNYAKENFSLLSQTMDGTSDSLQLGKASYNKQDYNKALTYFENIYRAHPENNDALVNAGITYLSLKDYDNAIAKFDELSRKSLRANNGSFLKAVALLLRDKSNDRNEAKALLELVVQKSLAESAEAKKWLENWKE